MGKVDAMYSEKVIQKILLQLARRKLSPKRAYERLRNLPYETFSFARIDHHRHLRKGLPEVVYAPGKTLDQLTRIIRAIQSSGQPTLVTRVEAEVYRRLKKRIGKLRYSKEGRVAYSLPNGKISFGNGAAVAVVCAGTSDIPVAEEAALTLEILGRRVVRVYDCGVAGLHRLLDKLTVIQKSKAIICVAGMEGALASVMAGLVDKPIIAVPTSVGYGANFEGIAPLLTMLNTCAQGVVVVNIDNGFGAACFASLLP